MKSITNVRQHALRHWPAWAVVLAAAWLVPQAVCPAAAGEPSKPSKPAATEEKPGKDDPYAWKSLFDGKTLDGWKAANFGGEGEVKVVDGAIVMEMGNSMTGITYTGQPLRMNYELTLEGKRGLGNDFFCTTTFPVGKSPCSLVVGGWGGTVVGLSCVDFYDASDNGTTQFLDFKSGRWYRVRIRVTEAKIEAWVDDQPVVTQETAGHRFTIRDECDLCQPLGICTWCTEGAVRGMRVRRLTPEEEQPQEKK